jgi:phosphoglycolate phosphatase
MENSVKMNLSHAEMENTMYKWILFDLDGTLTDPKEGITKCFQYALRSFGIEEEDLEQLTKYIGPPLMFSFREYFDSDRKAEAAIDKYRERYSTIGLHENQVYPGIFEALEAAKKAGKKLALATSKPQHFAEQVMNEFHLAPYFDLMVGAAGETESKADVIRRVLKLAGLPAKNCKEALMVGDRKYDIEGANECGIDSVGVRFGYAKEHELEEAGATYVLSTTKELRDFLAEQK